MKTHLRSRFIFLTIFMVLSIGLVSAAGEGESGDDVIEVVLADSSWDSILVHNRIVAFILENGYGGYSVDFIPGDTVVLFNGVANGDIDATMESWHSNYPEAYQEQLDAGTIVNVGTNMPDGPQAWWVALIPASRSFSSKIQ